MPCTGCVQRLDIPCPYRGSVVGMALASAVQHLSNDRRLSNSIHLFFPDSTRNGTCHPPPGPLARTHHRYQFGRKAAVGCRRTRDYSMGNIVCTYGGAVCLPSNGKGKERDLAGEALGSLPAGVRERMRTGWGLDNLWDKTMSHLDSGAVATLKVMG